MKHNSILLTTSNPTDMIISGVWHGGSGTPITSGSGFTIIVMNPGAPQAAEYQIVNATLSSATASFVDPISAD